jgi:hypothetical protein
MIAAAGCAADSQSTNVESSGGAVSAPGSLAKFIGTWAWVDDEEAHPGSSKLSHFETLVIKSDGSFYGHDPTKPSSQYWIRGTAATNASGNVTLSGYCGGKACATVTDGGSICNLIDDAHACYKVAHPWPQRHCFQDRDCALQCDPSNASNPLETYQCGTCDIAHNRCEFGPEAAIATKPDWELPDWTNASTFWLVGGYVERYFSLKADGTFVAFECTSCETDEGADTGALNDSFHKGRIVSGRYTVSKDGLALSLVSTPALAASSIVVTASRRITEPDDEWWDVLTRDSEDLKLRWTGRGQLCATDADCAEIGKICDVTTNTCS